MAAGSSLDEFVFLPAENTQVHTYPHKNMFQFSAYNAYKYIELESVLF